MIDPKDCTIIIPHFDNNPDDAVSETEYALHMCLGSLQDWEGDLIIAYNGFKDWVSELVDDSIILEKQGQCRAVNAAAATVNTPWIFITNNDMIYAPGWWEKLTKNFEDNKVLCANLVEPRRGAPPFLEYFCGGAGGDFNKEKWLNFAANYREDANEVGFNMPLLIKKEVWDLIGGYDVNYDPWGSNSDSDLQAKIHLAGILPVRNRNCIVYHFSQTSGTFDPKNHEYWQKNWQYFVDKWGFERQASDKVWYSMDIIDEAKLKYHPHWENFYGEKKPLLRGMKLGETYGD